MRRPWPERVYAIVRSNSRNSKAMARGRNAHQQCVVTIPPELAAGYPRDQGFRWERDGEGLRLVPVAESPVSVVRWTSEEVALLHTPLTASEVSDRTGRSVTAVANKREELGIDVRALRRELRER